MTPYCVCGNIKTPKGIEKLSYSLCYIYWTLRFKPGSGCPNFLSGGKLYNLATKPTIYCLVKMCDHNKKIKMRVDVFIPLECAIISSVCLTCTVCQFPQSHVQVTKHFKLHNIQTNVMQTSVKTVWNGMKLSIKRTLRICIVLNWLLFLLICFLSLIVFCTNWKITF